MYWNCHSDNEECGIRETRNLQHSACPAAPRGALLSVGILFIALLVFIAICTDVPRQVHCALYTCSQSAVSSTSVCNITKAHERPVACRSDSNKVEVLPRLESVRCLLLHQLFQLHTSTPLFLSTKHWGVTKKKLFRKLHFLNALLRPTCSSSSPSVVFASAHTVLQHSNLLLAASLVRLPASGSPTDEPELSSSIPSLEQEYLGKAQQTWKLPHDSKCTVVLLRHGRFVQQLSSEVTNARTDPDLMALVHVLPANSDGQDTIRSSETVGSIDDGMAWAPPHLQTSHKVPPHPDKLRAENRIPGSYMQSAVGNTRLEVERATGSDVVSRLSPQLQLADFANETIGVSMLFCGRGLIGQWRRSRGCSGDKLKKVIAGKLPHCFIVGLADGLERRLFLGTSQTEHTNAPSTCTRIIFLPGRTASGESMLPMDVTDCKNVKCKGKSPHFRVEIVQKDGTSLWLYDAGPDEFRSISDSVSECRSYAKQRQSVLEELPSASQSRQANAPEQPGALKVPMVPDTGESPDKRKPSIPKLKLDGVGNYIIKPSQQAAPLPAPASTAIREAEALLAGASEQDTSVAHGTKNDGRFGNTTATLTATTGHVYVQGKGPGGHTQPIFHIPELQDGLSESGFQKWLFKGNMSSPRVPAGLQATTNGYTISNSPNEYVQRVTASPPPRQISSKTRNSVINVALNASEAATSSPATVNRPPSVYSTPSRQSQKQTDALSPATAEFKRPGVGTSPAQGRLPRLVSVSPQTRIDTDPHVMEQALANFDAYISENQDGPPAFIYGLMRERGNNPSRQQVVLM